MEDRYSYLRGLMEKAGRKGVLRVKKYLETDCHPLFGNLIQR